MCVRFNPIETIHSWERTFCLVSVCVCAHTCIYRKSEQRNTQPRKQTSASGRVDPQSWLTFRTKLSAASVSAAHKFLFLSPFSPLPENHPCCVFLTLTPEQQGNTDRRTAGEFCMHGRALGVGLFIRHTLGESQVAFVPLISRVHFPSMFEAHNKWELIKEDDGTRLDKLGGDTQANLISQMVNRAEICCSSGIAGQHARQTPDRPVWTVTPSLSSLHKTLIVVDRIRLDAIKGLICWGGSVMNGSEFIKRLNEAIRSILPTVIGCTFSIFIVANSKYK